MSRAKRVKVGDTIRVTNPRRVVRVGYPKCIDDFRAQAFALVDGLLREKLNKPGLKAFGLKPLPRSEERLVREMAYFLVNLNEFGGRERSVHTVYQPELLENKEFNVQEIKVVQTGIYSPPHSGWSHTYYGDEYEYESGGLGNRKTIRLFNITGWGVIGRGRRPDYQHEVWVQEEDTVRIDKKSAKD